jgi:hypothetical protein
VHPRKGNKVDNKEGIQEEKNKGVMTNKESLSRIQKRKTKREIEKKAGC